MYLKRVYQKKSPSGIQGQKDADAEPTEIFPWCVKFSVSD
jgi:hypothetical protein